MEARATRADESLEWKGGGGSRAARDQLWPALLGQRPFLLVKPASKVANWQNGKGARRAENTFPDVR